MTTALTPLERELLSGLEVVGQQASRKNTTKSRGVMVLQSIVVGVIATLFMDAVAWGQRRLWGIPSLDYALMGRCIGHLPQGRLVHRPISRSRPVPGERIIGWSAHYLTGIVFAAVFLLITGCNWVAESGPLSAILFGAATVAFPFLVLQPAMGAGLAARATPTPWTARARSLTAHVAFGVGLWLGTRVMKQIGAIAM